MSSLQQESNYVSLKKTNEPIFEGVKISIHNKRSGRSALVLSISFCMNLLRSNSIIN